MGEARSTIKACVLVRKVRFVVGLLRVCGSRFSSERLIVVIFGGSLLQTNKGGSVTAVQRVGNSRVCLLLSVNRTSIE